MIKSKSFIPKTSDLIRLWYEVFYIKSWWAILLNTLKPNFISQGIGVSKKFFTLKLTLFYPLQVQIGQKMSKKSQIIPLKLDWDRYHWRKLFYKDNKNFTLKYKAWLITTNLNIDPFLQETDTAWTSKNKKQLREIHVGLWSVHAGKFHGSLNKLTQMASNSRNWEAAKGHNNRLSWLLCTCI